MSDQGLAAWEAAQTAASRAAIADMSKKARQIPLIPEGTYTAEVKDIEPTSDFVSVEGVEMPVPGLAITYELSGGDLASGTRKHKEFVKLGGSQFQSDPPSLSQTEWDKRCGNNQPLKSIQRQYATKFGKKWDDNNAVACLKEVMEGFVGSAWVLTVKHREWENKDTGRSGTNQNLTFSAA